jgi:uncharacterized protein (TIGR02597 family)
MTQLTSLGLAPLLALGAIGAASFSYGQLPVSRQAAVMPVQVNGSSAVTPVGIPFNKEPAKRDIVASIAGTDITGTAGGYTAGAFANTHVLRIATGDSRGTSLLITANTATTLTVSGSIPTLVNGVDEFEIVPLPTLGSVFGDSSTGGPHDLAGANSAASADIVIIGASQYFYKSSGIASPGWKLTTAANAAGDLGLTVVIPDSRGVNIIRKGATKIAGVRGTARDTRAVISIPTGTSLTSWPFATETTLLNSGLQNSILGAGSAASADKIQIDGVQYFFKTSGINAPGWKTTSAPNAAQPGANNIVLNPGGRAFYVIRAGTPTSHAALETFVP